MTTTAISRINIYRASGAWCYSAWTADGFDHSDELDVPDGASEREARDEAAKLFPAATIARVDDITV